MVLLTCDSDINLALMSSSATEVTERVCSGISVSAAAAAARWRCLRPRLNLLANHLRAVTAATDAVAAATDAVAAATHAGT